MPSLAGYNWPDELDNIIIAKSWEYGCPLDLAYAFIAVESGFTVNALGDAGCSAGLLQLNTCGGQGTGYSVEELYNPVLNLDIGLPHIATAFRRFWSADIPEFDYIFQIALNSGHPCNSPETRCTTGGIEMLCSDPRSHCYASVVRTFNIWEQMFDTMKLNGFGSAPAPIITDDPKGLNNPPWPLPVTAPLQPGAPVVIGQSPEDYTLLALVGGLVGGAMLASSIKRKSWILKK